MSRKLTFHQHATINAHYADLRSRGYFLPGARNGLTPKQQADAIAWGHYLRALGIVNDPTHGGTVQSQYPALVNHTAHAANAVRAANAVHAAHSLHATHTVHAALAHGAHNPYMAWTPAQLHAETVKRGWRQ